MKAKNPQRACLALRASRAFSPARAFTLVEMLVVIGIIGILAAMTVSLLVNAAESRNKARARAGLEELKTVIESYKAKKGYFPPDNPANPMLNQLYYELSGATTVNNGASFTPYGGPQIFGVTIQAMFGRGGIMNATSDPQENPVFTHGFPPAQYGSFTGLGNNNQVNVLVCSVQPGPMMLTNADKTLLNPWRYVSTNPTNNSETFDLWIDIIIRGKTNRICNWNDNPIAL